MAENCENSCAGLSRAEQQIDDLRRQNGADHKEFRERMKELEMNDARQAERYDRIMDNLHDMKTDNKEILAQLPPLTHRVESLEKTSGDISGDVDEIKEKPAKRWEGLSSDVLKWLVLLILGIIAAKIGLSA